MLSICSQGQWLDLNRSQMSWIPDLFPRGPVFPHPQPSMKQRKGRGGQTAPIFHIVLSGRRRSGSHRGYSWAGAGHGLGLGMKNSREECTIAYSRPVAPLCRLTFLSSFIADSPGSAPREEEVPRSWSADYKNRTIITLVSSASSMCFGRFFFFF